MDGSKVCNDPLQVNIETNFKTAWNKFGQNKWIEADVFNRDYVDVLQHVVDTMKTLNGTTNPWTDDLNNKWISKLHLSIYKLFLNTNQTSKSLF